MRLLLIIAVLLLSPLVAQAAGSHLVLNGSSQYASGTTPSGTTSYHPNFSARLISPRLGHGTDQVIFDLTGYGIMYIKAVSVGVTNFQFVPTTGTGTVTLDITSYSAGFMFSLYWDSVRLKYVLNLWDLRGLNHLSATATTNNSSFNMASRAFRIGAKQDATLHLQVDIDFFRWESEHAVYSTFDSAPFPAYSNWDCVSHVLNYAFNSDLASSGDFAATLTGTGSPTFVANANVQPVALGRDLTGQAKGTIGLMGTQSYDYDELTTPQTLAMSGSWSCVSAPGAGCGALTFIDPTQLSTRVSGATAVGTYTFSFTVTDGSLTATDATVTIGVVAASAAVSNVSCYVDEACVVDASASTGYKTIDVNFGEAIPTTNPVQYYRMAIPKSTHQYHSAGAFTITATATDAQSSPTSSVATATATVTARPTASAPNTEDLTDSGNANFISTGNCTSDATGNMTKLQAAVDIAKGRNTVAQKVIVRANNGSGTQCTYSNQLVLKAPTGTAQILIESSAASLLPASHKRVVPATDVLNMPKILSTTTNVAPVTTSTTPVVAYYKLRGLDIETSATLQGNGIVNLGQRGVETEANLIAHDFVVQHCIIRPTNEFSVNVQNGVSMDADNVTLIDNYIGPLSYDGFESHGTNVVSATGNHVYNNNFISAGSNNIFFGGAVSPIEGQIPRYFEIRENHLWKDPLWEAGADGKSRVVKNHFETKNASDMVIQGNILENTWAAAQWNSVELQGTCDSGDWAKAENIDFSNNQLLNVDNGFILRGRNASSFAVISGEKWIIRNNLLTGLLDWFMQIGGGAPNVTMQHNTFAIGSTPLKTAQMTGFPPSGLFTYEDNISYEGTSAWFADGVGSTLASKQQYMPGFIMRNSIQSGGTLSEYPSGQGWLNGTPTFTNAGAGIFSLAGGSVGDNAASDGTDIGVNWPVLSTMTGNALLGDWTAIVPSAPAGVRGRINVRGKATIRP